MSSEIRQAAQAWFDEKADEIPDDSRQLLEKYSGIPPEEVMPHVQRIVCSPS